MSADVIYLSPRGVFRTVLEAAFEFERGGIVPTLPQAVHAADRLARIGLLLPHPTRNGAYVPHEAAKGWLAFEGYVRVDAEPAAPK